MPASCAAFATRVRHRGAGAHASAFDLDLVEAAAEPDHDPRHAAVAHDQIGAEPDDRDRNVAGRLREEIGQIVLVLRHEQRLRRPADAEPGERRQRLVREQAAARLELRLELLDEVSKHGRATPPAPCARVRTLPAHEFRACVRRARGSMPALVSSTVWPTSQVSNCTGSVSR